jgi:tetratricopeptide (TPR) repeat protein
VTSCLNTLGRIACAQQQYAKAQQFYEESLARAQGLGFGARVGEQVQALGDIAFATNRYEEATRHYQQTLAEYEKVGSYWRMAEIHIRLGNVALATGQYPQAEQHYSQALKAAVERQDTELGLRVLPDMAAVLAHPGNRHRSKRASPERQAAELALLALHHPESEERTKSKADALLREQEGQLAPEALTQAQERGRARDLWATVKELLAELGS